MNDNQTKEKAGVKSPARGLDQSAVTAVVLGPTNQQLERGTRLDATAAGRGNRDRSPFPIKSYSVKPKIQSSKAPVVHPNFT